MTTQDPDDPSWSLPAGISSVEAERLSRWFSRGKVRICGYPRCGRPATKDGHCAEGHPGVRYER